MQTIIYYWLALF